jgi:Kef-type K+ transport system membrane component KefB
MKRFRNILFYAGTIIGFSILMYLVFRQGKYLELGKKIIPQTDQPSSSSFQGFIDNLLHNVTYPLAILVLQIIAIIIVARIFGYFFRKIGQPSVIGEILAGIVLGPSVVGMYFPEFSAFLFPVSSLANLQFLSQIGLILFMFVVGMELDLNVLRNKAADAIVISHASIIFPFSLGVGLSYFVYTRFAPADVHFLSFALFMGIAMSITAFPVLARIVQERGLTKTRLGAIVITCAAADDVTAWCLLAMVIAVVKAGSAYSAFFTIVMALAYVIIMLKLVQPFLKRYGAKHSDKESLSKPVVAVFFITMLLSAYATEIIGIHALFGAFMAGVIMPANVHFRSLFIEKLEDVSLVLLLPLFFVFTGLRTQIGLLNEPYLWKICALIILVAVVGKFLGSALAARFTGQNWRDSLSIGALMNARGLMELVVLNIGYDLGVLSPEIFAMLVLMALATTFMTGPALDLINRFWPDKKVAEENLSTGTGRYKILVSFSSPAKGVSLLQLAGSLIKRNTAQADVTMLHLSPSNELNQYNLEEYERESFMPIEDAARKLKLPVTKMFKPSAQIDSEITQTANAGHYSLLLIGFGSSVFEGTLLGKILGFTTRIINPERLYETITGKEKLFDADLFDERIKNIVKSTRIPVGIFMQKGSPPFNKILIPIFSISDSFILIYAQKLMQHNQSFISVADVNGVIRQNPELQSTLQSVAQTAPGLFSLHEGIGLTPALLRESDLLLVSYDQWKLAVEAENEWLSHTPSVLIIKP